MPIIEYKLSTNLYEDWEYALENLEDAGVVVVDESNIDDGHVYIETSMPYSELLEVLDEALWGEDYTLEEQY